MLLFIAVCAALCGGLVYLRDAAIGPYPPGPVANLEDLPLPLRDKLAAVDKAGVKLTNVEFFRVCSGTWSDHVLRCDYSPGALKPFGHQSVPANSRYVQLFWDAMPESWMTRTTAMNIDFYACSGWLEGSEGDLYMAMHDKSANKLYIWYHFNF